MATYPEFLSPIKSHDPLNMCLRDKLELLNFPYHNAYSHKTGQGGDILPGVPTHRVIFISLMVLHIKYILRSSSRSTGTKLQDLQAPN